MNHQVSVFHASKERHLPREVCSYCFIVLLSVFFLNLREICDSSNVGLLGIYRYLTLIFIICLSMKGDLCLSCDASVIVVIIVQVTLFNKHPC